MKTGTSYFPSYGAALRYYRPYCEVRPGLFPGYVRTQELRALVDAKLNAREIHIGKPDIKPGQRLSIQDNRWHVEEAAP
jgi:hypothetical protein